jgi:hypothetical protein
MWRTLCVRYFVGWFPTYNLREIHLLVDEYIYLASPQFKLDFYDVVNMWTLNILHRLVATVRYFFN